MKNKKLKKYMIGVGRSKQKSVLGGLITGLMLVLIMFGIVIFGGGGGRDLVADLMAEGLLRFEDLEENEVVVVRVVDGDTMVVRGDDGVEEKVRLLGIDTPEISGGVECYAVEAKDRVEELVSGKSVLLSFDDKKTKDKYGRTLAYVWVEELNLNRSLVSDGFARVYRQSSFKLKSDFLVEEEKAKLLSKGLWNSSNCPMN